MNDTIRMQISAFVDGELADGEADLLLRRMGQDAELRRAASEFLELGRAIRGESSVAGVERLRERIALAIDENAVSDEEAETEDLQTKSLRPLAGIAIAASVALVALISLQYVPGTDTGAVVDGGVGEVAEETGITVPALEDEVIRQYRVNQGDVSEEATGDIKTELVTLRDSEEVPAEEEAEDDAEAEGEEESADETTSKP